MTIYLYVKTHNKTKLKYLGKTVKDPFSYYGSGKYWLKHIKKHGYDVTTEIIFQTDCGDTFKQVAYDYSVKHDIVESSEWANLILETGSGGDNPLSKTAAARNKYRSTRIKNKKTWSQTKESNNKRSVSHKNYWKSDRAKERRKKEFVGPPKPPGWFLNNRIKLECPHCNKIGQSRNMKRWHFDNCKLIPK